MNTRITPIKNNVFDSCNFCGSRDHPFELRSDRALVICICHQCLTSIIAQFNKPPVYGQWIDVNVRQPEYMEVVLIAIRDLGTVTQAQYGGETDHFSIGDDWLNASHWMPLPPSPGSVDVEEKKVDGLGDSPGSEKEEIARLEGKLEAFRSLLGMIDEDTDERLLKRIEKIEQAHNQCGAKRHRSSGSSDTKCHH